MIRMSAMTAITIIDLSGHVSSTGAIRVSVSSGGQEAKGEGRRRGHREWILAL